MSATKSNATHAKEVRKKKAGGVNLRNLAADPRLFELSYSSSKGAEHEIRACAFWEYARSSKHVVRRIEQVRKNGPWGFLAPLEPFVKILGPNTARLLITLTNAKRSGATQSFSFPALDWFACRQYQEEGGGRSVAAAWIEQVQWQREHPIFFFKAPFTVFDSELKKICRRSYKYFPTQLESDHAKGKTEYFLFGLPTYLSMPEKLSKIKSALTLTETVGASIPSAPRAVNVSAFGERMRFNFRAALRALFVLRAIHQCRGDWEVFEKTYAGLFRRVQGRAGLPERVELADMANSAVAIIRSFETGEVGPRPSSKSGP